MADQLAVADQIDGIRLDISDWPIARVWPGKGVNEANTLVLLAEVQRWIDRGEPFAILFDHTHTEALPPRLAFLAADALRPLLPRFTSVCRGFCSYTPNPILRTIVRGTLALMKLPIPTAVVGTPEEVEQWLLMIRLSLRADAVGSDKQL